MAIVSTGQLTIVDQNDARPITAFVSANGPLQQIFTKDESTSIYTPDRTSSPLTLTANVYVGGVGAASEVAAMLTNRKWSTTFDGTSIGANPTLVVNTNLTEIAPTVTYYFQGDYTDPVTGLSNRVNAQITLNLVKTGTNAVFLQLAGSTVIEQSTSGTKNVVRLYADLIRAAGVDDTGITYRWRKQPFGLADVLDGNYPGITTAYGFLTTAQVNANKAAALTTTGAIGQYNGAAITTTNLPDATNLALNTTAGGWNDTKGILINELGVTDIAVYQVEAKDADGMIYQAFFTIYDVSDPYETRLVSSTGDKLQNGQGTSDVYPRIYYGATEVTNLTGWKFLFTLFDGQQNKRAGFIDTTKTALAGGRDITANTTGASATFNYSGANITFAAGEVIKVVRPNGVPSYFEVASATTNQVTIRAATTNTWLAGPLYAYPTVANEFQGGKFFACTANPGGTFNGVAVTGQGGARITTGATGLAAKIVVTGDEVDVKAVINCESDRP